ncbi:hypothetical protein FKG94_00775 [Exilibacterium tricleocarpae]|uniref:Uncharacterized protein n=2 Tax=Exilibacterium tricleocarpae TaxID=2591008 RepID=A0A545UA58_9GAMM|nr:hypothetical protein FKG94_00775 [Exilibacterium tricleocarpae]
MGDFPPGLVEAANFPLIEAIHGRRSRRFARGASIPGGPLAYTSKHPPQPLDELQQLLLLTAVCGNTGWSNLIPYNRHYRPAIPNYAAAAGGRSFPSAAGFHTTEIFYTDDKGVYFFPTRDLAPLTTAGGPDEADLGAYLDAHKNRIIKLADGRLNTPASPMHMEMHNDWCANVPGSTLIIPVADLAQHLILVLCYLVQNGVCVYDDINGRAIPGIEQFKGIVDTDNAYPLSVVEQTGLTEVTVEVSTACYSGALMLQALGLGGWMYEGINPLSILGASNEDDVPGLGFRYDTDERWPLPNVTGLQGIFEGHCPPHFSSMGAAVDAVLERKFGSGGPYNAKTLGPYKNNAGIRGRAMPHGEEFRNCVVTIAQYIFDTFGRFPASVPSIFAMMYLQAHALDTDFYDKYFSPGAYLRTHARYATDWVKP